MTALEKLRRDHPDFDEAVINAIVDSRCPDDYAYLDVPDNCSIGVDEISCRACWNREIPGTENKEKENENMSDIPERTDATKYKTCGLDYKAEYEKLKELIQQKDFALLENMNQHEDDEKEIAYLKSLVGKYRFGLRVVEAFLGTDIVEDFE